MAVRSAIGETLFTDRERGVESDDFSDKPESWGGKGFASASHVIV
jgi:hypothetical protein